MKYEIMFIVRPDLEDAKIKEVVAELEGILTNNKAKIIASREIGQKKLAYEIKKYKSGYYFVYRVLANETIAVDEFNRLALLNENIIRHMIIKLEEEKR